MNSEFIKNTNMFRVICMIRTKFCKGGGVTLEYEVCWPATQSIPGSKVTTRAPFLFSPTLLSVLLGLFFKTPFPFTLPFCPAVRADVTLTLSHWVLLASGPDANCSASEYSVLTSLGGICLAFSSFLIRTKSRFFPDLRLLSLGCVLLFV